MTESRGQLVTVINIIADNAQTASLKTPKSLRFLVSARVTSDPRGNINLLFFPLWNDVQLQPKLLDWLEFCHAVF